MLVRNSKSLCTSDCTLTVTCYTFPGGIKTDGSRLATIFGSPPTLHRDPSRGDKRKKERKKGRKKDRWRLHGYVLIQWPTLRDIPVRVPVLSLREANAERKHFIFSYEFGMCSKWRNVSHNSIQLTCRGESNLILCTSSVLAKTINDLCSLTLVQVNWFQKFIWLIVQYKYLKSCSKDFVLQHLILRTRLWGTEFITQPSGVFDFCLYWRVTSFEKAFWRGRPFNILHDS